ncbi:radical SAM/SPASM domain-containing protein [Bradyrhizobium jicamae]|uniref:radical SAM/SPASM domain-containing protein n=1 Tax=Bradyrhizobium jicamae TaxID=280332 RepID=UPI001BAD152F|nr:radical SAM protein [Bradyrhizobium jicamae]MBR0938582.1 radical SAM protein [Bradyrhizobium jicamae]
MDQAPDDVPRRRLSLSDQIGCVPVYVVWELTLACNLKCIHCGSRAGHKRAKELTTDECIDVIRQLAGLGTREISIIGGEAFIRRDWLIIIRAIRDHGIDCTMQTGGYKFSGDMIRAAADAGLLGLGVSVDGLEPLHDRLRGVKGSYREALRVLGECRRAGLTASVNTQITSAVMRDLPDVMEVIIDAGAKYWQVQLTVAMGNAVDHEDILLQPYDLATLMPLLAELHLKGRERDLVLLPGNNVGYFGPYDVLWRGPDRGYYSGCPAGQNVIGLEADGTVKGCPSLATDRYGAGDVRSASLADLWATHPALQFNRDRSTSDLWGFCRDCYYAEACRGGCTWTSDSLLGRRGNNPYCHHRVLTLAERGLRERIVKVEDAPARPFATGRFALVEEPLPTGALRT